MSITQVEKRNGTLENVSFDKITERVRAIANMIIINCSGSRQWLTPHWGQPITTIDPITISQKICARVHHKIKTSELDALSSELCASMGYLHPDYERLAARICINNHHKITPNSIRDVVRECNNNVDRSGNKSPLFAKHIADFIIENAEILDDMIQYDRDYDIDFFGFKTLVRSYLFKSNGRVIERPQHLWMRVAVCIHLPREFGNIDLANIFDMIQETYYCMSCKKFTHATPTLFHAGSERPQMSSCFLMGTEDSVEGIYKTVQDTALISKWAGGIGLHISNIRANGSYIRKTAGHSFGIMPMLKVYNDTARHINQSGRRSGSFAMYLEPWHADIFAFLDAKKNQGAEEERARDLFYALWIPDLFMIRVRDDLQWSLMCPDQSPGLDDVYGDEFEQLYCKYEADGQYIKQIKARDVWRAIINSQIETGTPYMTYKDASNKCSNQKNIGVIKSSNLCSEIMQYSDSHEYGVCNLASLNLTSFVELSKNTIDLISTWSDNSEYENIIYTIDVDSNDDDAIECEWCVMLKGLLRQHSIPYREIKLKRDDFGSIILPECFRTYDVKTVPQLFRQSNSDNNRDNHIGGYDAVWELLKPKYNYDELHKITQMVTRNLNRVIDINYYPVPETRRSNLKHRPIGIGVQGLADVFQMMRVPFDSMEARILNAGIHETMYHGALEASHRLAACDGAYDTFRGSPLSEGKFQFNLWSLNNQQRQIEPMEKWDWETLRDNIVKDGVRNSLLIALMPTASTSQILGNNECFEPYTSNMYTRRVLAGEFTVINRHLIRDLQHCDLWDESMAQSLIAERGSVKNLQIPDHLKSIYKTSWELKQKVLIDMARDRGFYICQSQSLNLFFERPDYETLSKAHQYSWKRGLKTGSYYIRSKPAIASQQFTVAVKPKKTPSQPSQNEPCEMCSS